MSRGKCASLKNSARRQKLVDSRYNNSVLVSRLIRALMVEGKAAKARSIVYQAMESATLELPKRVELPEHNGPRDKELVVLEKALSIIIPRTEIKSRKVGGASYQIPIMINKERGMTLALRWLVTSARKRSEGKPMHVKLSREIVATLEGKSATLHRKETQDKIASANRANTNLIRKRDSQPAASDKE
jgi:small subunit ribosomal protein S7